VEFLQLTNDRKNMLSTFRLHCVGYLHVHVCKNRQMQR